MSKLFLKRYSVLFILFFIIIVVVSAFFRNSLQGLYLKITNDSTISEEYASDVSYNSVASEYVQPLPIQTEPEQEVPFDPLYLDFLWKGISHDSANNNIKLVIEEADASFNPLIQGYLMPISAFHTPSADYDNERMNDFFYRVWSYLDKNRASVDIVRLYKSYSNLILQVIPQRDFYRKEYNVAMRLLNTSYYDLLKYDDESREYDYSNFGKIYEILIENERQVRKFIEQQGNENKGESEIYYMLSTESIRKRFDGYTKIKEYVSDDALGSFIKSGKIDEERVLWAYSFWGRRYKEGSILKTRELFEAISETYEYYEESY